MKQLLILIVILLLTFSGLMGCVFGVQIANEYWNCSRWHSSTGESTQVIAGSCYVQEGSKWVLFDTHVKNHHVEVETN